MILSRATFKQTKFTASQVQVAKTPLATFSSNVSGLYIPEILAYFSATQSGTGDPSPSNPRAISGVSSVDTTRTGKNLLNTNETLGTVSGVTATLNADGSITLNGTSTGTGTIRLNRKVSLPYATYTFTAESRTGVAISVQTSGGNKSASSTGITFTASVSGLFWIYFNSTGIVFDNYTIHPQIELGSTATEYESYTGTTATTALGGTYYGGYVNVTTGLMTVTHDMVDMGTLNWQYYNNLFNASIPNFKTPETYQDRRTGFICSCYAPDTQISISPTSMTDKTALRLAGSLFIKETDYTSAPDFKTAVTGQQLVYELATPQTVQLTPAQLEQLLGQNNVFCSSGDVAVKYWKID